MWPPLLNSRSATVGQRLRFSVKISIIDQLEVWLRLQWTMAPQIVQYRRGIKLTEVNRSHGKGTWSQAWGFELKIRHNLFTRYRKLTLSKHSLSFGSTLLVRPHVLHERRLACGTSTEWLEGGRRHRLGDRRCREKRTWHFPLPGDSTSTSRDLLSESTCLRAPAGRASITCLDRQDMLRLEHRTLGLRVRKCSQPV